MDQAQYDRVAELVGKLIEVTDADELVWVGNSIFGTATARRNGIKYTLDFPSKTLVDRTFFVDEQQAWHGPELNQLVVAVTEQWERLHPQPAPPPPRAELNEETASTAVDRALKTF